MRFMLILSMTWLPHFNYHDKTTLERLQGEEVDKAGLDGMGSQ